MCRGPRAAAAAGQRWAMGRPGAPRHVGSGVPCEHAGRAARRRARARQRLGAAASITSGGRHRAPDKRGRRRRRLPLRCRRRRAHLSALTHHTQNFPVSALRFRKFFAPLSPGTIDAARATAFAPAVRAEQGEGSPGTRQGGAARGRTRWPDPCESLPRAPSRHRAPLIRAHRHRTQAVGGLGSGAQPTGAPGNDRGTVRGRLRPPLAQDCSEPAPPSAPSAAAMAASRSARSEPIAASKSSSESKPW